MAFDHNVITKAFFVGSESHRHQFSQSKCVLPISVGQPYHEEEKLSATIELVTNRFQSCTIILCDSLQRHTLQLANHMSTDEAYRQAKMAGLGWLERNKVFFRLFTIPFQIKRWDQYLLHSDYPKQREKVEQFYRENVSFRESFDFTISQFVSRFLRKHTLYDYAVVFNHCMEYIKEECSIMPLWIKERFHFEVYPGKRIPAMLTVHEVFVRPHFPQMLQWIRVNFKQVTCPSYVIPSPPAISGQQIQEKSFLSIS